MKIELNKIYINGFLQPLESEIDKNYISYPCNMIPINAIAGSYRVDINGIEDRGVDNNKLDMFTKVNSFNNRISSANITDLFSMLYHVVEDNITTYTHHSTIKTLNFCPDRLGLLDLNENYKPLALHATSIKLYVDIHEKQTNLLNILSH